MRYALILPVLCLFPCPCPAAEIKCPAKADVWLSSVGEERETNGGKSARIKLKIYQEFGLLDFDVAALKGKRIASAALHVAPAGGAIHGKERGTDLRWFTFSTVSSPWEEGEGASYAKDEKGKGATFNEASYKTRPWTVPGSKVFDVTLGNGNSLRCDSDGGDPYRTGSQQQKTAARGTHEDEYFTVPLDKRLIEALVAGCSHGLLIMDGSTGVDRNSYIHSRESKKPPYLTVVVGADDATPPAAPTNITIKPAPADASPKEGAALVSLTVPTDAFAYAMKLDGKDLPRWQIPFAPLTPNPSPARGEGGRTQSFLLEHLPPDAEIKLEIAALDSAGNLSPFASATGRSSPKFTVPPLPESDWKPAGGAPPVAGDKVKVWAFPEICKLDPLTGKIVLEKGMDDAASKNSVWDAKSATVRVCSARGEIAAFQIALESLGDAAQDVKLEIAGLDGVQTRQWRTWFVKIKNNWQGDYAIPLKAGEAVAIPAPDNKIPGQKAAVVAVDLIVAPDARPGKQTGKVTLAGAGLPPLQLALELNIFDAVIPAEPYFTPELNAYGGPGEAGSEYFFDAHRVAHYHRCAINRVPYSQSGNIHTDSVPQVGPDGRVTDWSRYDKNLGPLLDGSAFKDNPRAGVPVPLLYLPLFEHWPLPMRPHYHPGVDARGKEWKAVHDIKAKPIEESFDQPYKDAFAACAADFAMHFAEKGWTKTKMQCFQNNKHQYAKDGPGGTAWMMDEPNEYLDWRALNFYSDLFRKGVAAAKPTPPPQFVYRADVSRPQWQGSVSDGLMEMMIVGGDMYNMPAVMRGQKRRAGMQLIVYGSANSQERANLESAAWCLKGYVHECDGVIPWQSLGGDEAFDTGDRDGHGNSLIVDGRKRFGGAIASFRAHAFRSGAQLCELLRLLELKNPGWGRGHSGALIAPLIPLGAQFQQSFTDDAAALKFGDLNGDSFVRLKEGILKLLAK